MQKMNRRKKVAKKHLISTPAVEQVLQSALNEENA